MSKTATKRAIRSLPALRASLIWFKREVVRGLEQRADGASPKLRAFYAARAAKVRRTDLADLRADYQTQRVGEISRDRRFELTRAVPSIVWMTA